MTNNTKIHISATPTLRSTTITVNNAEKKILQLEDDELTWYRNIGSGVGVSFEHCVAEGVWHCPDFLRRVAGFRFEDDPVRRMTVEAMTEAGMRKKAQEYVSVTFFQRKKCRNCGRTSHIRGIKWTLVAELIQKSHEWVGIVQCPLCKRNYVKYGHEITMFGPDNEDYIHEYFVPVSQRELKEVKSLNWSDPSATNQAWREIQQVRELVLSRERIVKGPIIDGKDVCYRSDSGSEDAMNIF